MKKYLPYILLLGAMLVAAFTVAGCRATTEQPAPAADIARVDADIVPALEGASDAAPVDDAANVVPDDGDSSQSDLAVPAVENHCLECHTDQQSLMDTAKPEEPVAQESEGEG